MTLDARDDEPAAFLTCVVAALQTAAPEVGKTIPALLRLPQLPPIETILTDLVNDLSSLPGELVLVLDDYHAIANPAIHSAVTFLLDHLPPKVRLIIATRADPPLPISRLRSRGELTEIRADELRFEPAEAAAFLGPAMGLRLTGDEVTVLTARTEGWIAGLQLAALSLRGRPEVSRFVAAFAGTHRYVVDYLIEEVLSRQPEPVQTFLLRTSVLEQLSGPLCDAVTDQAHGEAMLERLERANLFVVPLDDERRWYRYHRLFAEALRHQLRRAEPALVRVLHSRASEWYERRALVEQAFQHALSAEDFERAAGLVERSWNRLAQAGETNIVLRWLEALPDEVVRRRPALGTWYGWTLLFKGQIAAAETRLADAESALSEQVASGEAPSDETWRAGLFAAMVALRSLLLRHRGDFQGAIEAAQQAIDQLDSVTPGPSLSPTEYASLRCSGYLNMAHAFREVGDHAKTLAAYVAGVPLARAAGNTIGVTTGTFYLARLQQRQGRLHDAAETCQEALRYAAEHNLEQVPAFALVHVALGDVLREWNELDAADHHVQAGVELGRRGGYLDAVKNGGIVLAQLRRARGDLGAALAAIEEAERAVHETGAQLAGTELAAYRARIQVEHGALAAAGRWAEAASRDVGAGRGHTREIEALVLARVLVAQGRASEAVERLSQLLAVAGEEGLVGSEIEILVLRALAFRAQGQIDRALTDLKRALARARPEGYARVFLDEGPEMAHLLRRALLRVGPASPLGHYVDGLLSQLPVWSEELAGLAIRHEAAESILVGMLPDQAALHGVLARLRDLNLRLVSVRRLEAGRDE